MDRNFYAPLHRLHCDSVLTDVSVPFTSAWGMEAVDFRGKIILEAGCGGMAAQAVQLAALDPAHLDVIDLSHDNCRSAEGIINSHLPKFNRFSIKPLDLCNDPLPKEKYDIIHHRGVFPHLADSQFALRNFWNALRPGGVLLITAYGCGGLLAWVSAAIRTFVSIIPIEMAKRLLLALKITPDLISGILDHLYVPIQIRYSRDGFSRLVMDAGFVIEKDVADLTHEVSTAGVKSPFFRWWATRVYPNSSRKIRLLSFVMFGKHTNALVCRKVLN